MEFLGCLWDMRMEDFGLMGLCIETRAVGFLHRLGYDNCDLPRGILVRALGSLGKGTGF